MINHNPTIGANLISTCLLSTEVVHRRAMPSNLSESHTYPDEPRCVYSLAPRYPELSDQAAAVATALVKLNVRPDDRVLIMLPDGPGFVDAFVGTMRQGAVPLPVNPLLSVHELVTAATEAGARLVLASTDRIPEWAELDAEPPVLVEGPQGTRTAALRLH